MTMWDQLLATLDQLFNQIGCCSTVLTIHPNRQQGNGFDRVMVWVLCSANPNE